MVSTKRSKLYKIQYSLHLDSMDNWDEAKLNDVVQKKHGEKEKNMPKTDIVSY